MSLMAVPDVIVYQALVNIIADQSHPFLISHENEHILGNLYAGAGNRWMLKPWKHQFSRFVERVEKLYHIGNSWIASTDIVAFYDTIDHERLSGLVSRYCGDDKKFEDLFRQCLSKWSAHNADSTMGRGIPQGSNASDFLANLYLHEIDRKLISNGYTYVRYVDDIRILGADISTVQHGLILFDLELKCAGLVAQVNKTSVHKIEDIEKEVSRLRFVITDPTGTGEYTLFETPSPPISEQAESASEYIESTPSEQTEFESGKSDDTYSDDIREEEANQQNQYIDIDQHKFKTFQKQLINQFLEALKLLDNPERGKEAESHVTFCLYRLEPHEAIRNQGINLLTKLPWRSEAVCSFLGRFKNDCFVIEELRNFISEHKVYSWHRANSLWAMYQASEAKDVASICRVWLADGQLDWYARMIAARILAEVPGQHAYLLECLKREQEEVSGDGEATAMLRQELAYAAFQRIKSHGKQLALLLLICSDKSPILHRLAIYLLQQPGCKVVWDDLKIPHNAMSIMSGLVNRLGLSTGTSKPCFIAQTMTKTYKVSLSQVDLRTLYANHYIKAVENLRESVINFQKSPSLYIGSFHQFTHITFVALYEYIFPSELGIYDSNYAHLIERKIFKENFPHGIYVWASLNSMRNRVEHPLDKKTKSHSQKLTIKEIALLHKQLETALQELFNIWLITPTNTTVVDATNTATEVVEIHTTEVAKTISNTVP